MKQHKVLLYILVAFAANTGGDRINDAEKQAMLLVEELSARQIVELNEFSEASWNYDTNINEENAIKKEAGAKKFAEFSKQTAFKLLKIDTSEFRDENLKRMIRKLTDIGDSILEPADFAALKEAIMRMSTNYAKSKVTSFVDKSKKFSLEPELTKIMARSRDPEELKYYWINWHDKAGKPAKDDYFNYVRLRNKAAEVNNFTSGAEYWLNAYEDPSFEQQVEKILEQIQPLYFQLHGYVRHKLFEFYGPEHVNLSKPIPIHLLGNMWGQQWDIPDIVVPYKNKQTVDVTEEMLRQNYTPLKMFRMAEEFFMSMNMSQMPESFWTKSVIERPNDGRDMVCHASAWDFAIGDDFRIKQCTRVAMESFVTIHHEMGHVEYYLQYKDLPLPYRTGANPGFHEAIGDVISLSVSTHRHLKRIGLLRNFTPDGETTINQLIRFGLSKLAFLPFAYVVDKFRWEVFRGNVKREEANCYFWAMRELFGGVEPSNVRTNRDFDITAKYHASADVEYLRYFVSMIVQIQFHKAACIKAGEYEPNNPEKTLNNCDIYQSVDAGNAIKSMLAMGASRPWPDAMEAMTGQRELDASAFLEYFKPLEDWLVKTNKELGVQIGWEASDKIDCSI